jgi:hypothetical protein
MKTRRNSLLFVTLLGLALLTQLNATAADKSTSPDKNLETGGLSAVLGAVGVPQMPSLSGLIRPEKMGLLADNKLTASDNEAHLLSGNEADVDILSDNTVNILSGVRLLSGVTVKVQISIHRDQKKPKAKKRRAKGNSRKSKR